MPVGVAVITFTPLQINLMSWWPLVINQRRQEEAEKVEKAEKAEKAEKEVGEEVGGRRMATLRIHRQNNHHIAMEQSIGDGKRRRATPAPPAGRIENY